MFTRIYLWVYVSKRLYIYLSLSIYVSASLAQPLALHPPAVQMHAVTIGVNPVCMYQSRRIDIWIDR